MTGRRGLTTAVLLAVGGAGLALLGASRTWSSETVAQPPPLSPQVIVHTGGSYAPALPALGLVALAAAGGLLATRGTARRLVGALLVAAGATELVLTARVLAGGSAGAGWPVMCLAGAALTAAAGVLAVRAGGRWPEMGSRYGRSGPPADVPTSHGPPASAGRTAAGPTQTPASTAELWDALERGEDPTRG